MEQQKLSDEAYRKVKEIAGPIFKKAISPVEHLPNPMRGTTPKIIRLIQPHNFRRYFNFSKDQNPTYNPTIPYSEKNYKSEHHYQNFHGCHIIIRKTKAEVINLWHQKQWRLLEAESIDDVNARIDQIKQEMETQAVQAMEHFISVNGGFSDLVPIEKRKTEIGIHGDEYIDKIPPEMVIHDTHFKKVYKEKVEFLGEASVKNYISNRAVEQLAPEIDKSISKLNEGIEGIRQDNRETWQRYEKYIKAHTDFIEKSAGIAKETLKTLKKLNSKLSQSSLKRWLR